MILNVKKTLLAGTALVAVAGFAVQANAADLTLTGAATWGTAANGMVATPTSGDNVILDTNTLTINGSELGVTTIGAITSASTGAVTITNADDAADVAITIGSIAITGAGNITQSLTDVTTRDIASTITGNVSTGGNLVLTNVEPDAAATNAMAIGGTLAVTGTTGLTAGNFAGASTTTLSVGGNATFTGAVTVTGGANAAADATLTLTGATNAFTAGLTLTDGAAGAALLVLNGAVAQTVSGNIAGTGDVTVDNALGATFSGTVGAGTNVITIEKSAGVSSATFQNTLNAATITLGGANTGTNTLTLDSTTNDFTVTGTVDGTATAAEVNNVVVSGTGTVTTATAWGGVNGNLDSVTVSGSGTILSAGASMTTTAFTVGSGATLQTSGAATLTGTINGAGSLDINAATTIAGVVGGTTALTSVDVAAGTTLTLNGTTTAYTATTTTLSGVGTGILALTGGATSQTLTTDIVTATDDAGQVTIADGTGTTAFVGDIGSSSAQLANLTLAGGSNNTVTTTGDLYVNTITLDDSDVLQFLGTGAQTVSGVILGVGANDGVVTVGNGTTATPTVTFAGLLGGGGTDPGALTVNAGATAVFAASGTHEIDGTITNSGTIQVNAGDTLSTAGATAGTGTYNIGVSKSAGTQTHGKVVETGDTDLSANTIHFLIDSSQPLTTGTSVLDAMFNDDNTDAVIAGATVTDNSFIYGFSLVNDTANDEVDVTIFVENAFVDTANTSGNINAGTLLITDLATSTNTEINQIQDNLVSASTQGEMNDILESVNPTVDGGAVVAGFQASAQSISLSTDRLAALRTSETGVASGNMSTGVTAWMQGFGKKGTQDERDGIDGYDADTFGAAVGVDTENVADDVVLGVSVSYANSDVSSDNVNRTKTDVDSYQVSLYGDYDIDQSMYVSGNIGYAWNNIDQIRHNVGGISGLTATADYDSNQFMASGEIGRDYAVGTAVITPSVGVDYQHIYVDSYTESGAGGANLNVDNDDLNILEVGVGAKAKWNIPQADGSEVVPSLHAGVRHDVIGDEVQSTSSFTGGGASFNSQGVDPAQTTFDVGGAMTLYTTDNWALTGSYDYEAKSDYASHAGYARAGYKF